MPRSENTPVKTTPTEIFLKDYKKPDFTVLSVDMTVRIFNGYTLVETVLDLQKDNPETIDLSLDAVELEIEEVLIDETPRKEGMYDHDGRNLTVFGVPETFKLRTVVKIKPEENTALEGLYKSESIYCTQCEAEGFRKITPYFDRPDVLSKFTVRIEADKATSPILLSNGNEIDSGDLPSGRHFVTWNDPFNKPAYLFALVAADLDVIEDTFTTMSGRNVDLKIFTDKGDTDKCHFAMTSLKNSMKWDEEAYGREYDLDIFQIVAVSAFNFGAMENKSLNIFNTSTLFASQETATDSDFMRVEAVVGHEYFHNWSGNRVTCRDWFQLSLKEGFTVFREQGFSGAMNSHAVQRIQDVNFLKTHQFKEDASPTAHPIRPESYIEINNFYTLTIYEKGSEVIRMMHTIMGEDPFRKGSDLYFDRFDGTAATCNDFVACMEEASGLDLTHFKLWYEYAGTPLVEVTQEHDMDSGVYKLHFKQTIPDTPGQTDKDAMYIPISLGLIGADGNPVPVSPDGTTNMILHFDDDTHTVEFTDIHEKVVPSILRGFSAPVNLKTDLANDDYLYLMAHDTDGFNRWESGQAAAKKTLLNMIKDYQSGVSFSDLHGDTKFVNQMGWIIEHQDGDLMLLAESLKLPSTSILSQALNVIDVNAIHFARKALMKQIGTKHLDLLKKTYASCTNKGLFDTSTASIGRRALRNVCLGYIAAAHIDTGFDLATQQYETADNMTARMGALSVLADDMNGDTQRLKRDEIFTDFYNRFKTEALVINKWFALQASADRADCHAHIERLMQRDDFSWTNPNRLRSLIGSFAGNSYYFHYEDGRGYKMIADAVIKLNAINPSVGARLVNSLKEWKKYDEHRQMHMKQQLERILNTPNLSNHIYEIVSKALNA